MYFDNWINFLSGYREPVADWLSIFSFFLSGYVAFEVSRIKQRILAKIRLPQLIMDVQNSAGSFPPLLRDFRANEQAINGQITICWAQLEILKTLVAGPVKAEITEILKVSKKSIGGHHYVAMTAKEKSQSVWMLYHSLNGLLEKLKHESEQLRIGVSQ